MKDQSANQELIEEISSLKQRIKELEQSEVIRKQTEQALQQFRARVEATNDWVWEMNIDGCYTYSSPKIKDFLGYEPEELIGKTPFFLMPKYEAERLAPMFKKNTKSQQSFSGRENIKLHKDGREIVFETSGTPVVDTEGNFMGYRGIDRDITERKKAEVELRRMNLFLDSIVENIPNMIFIKDARNLRFVRFNRAGEDLLGNSREILIGKSDYDFFPKDQADFFTQKDQQVLRGKEIVDIPEESIQTRNKGERILHTKKVPILDVKGQPEYLLGISEDITEHRKVKEALIESEAKYRTIVESSLVGVYIIQDGLFRFVNRRWCEMYGYTYDEVVNKINPLDLTFPEDRKLMSNNFQKCLSGETDHLEYELRAVRKDGKIIVMRVLDTVMLYNGHSAISGTLDDVTEHRKVEEELRQKTALLEAQVNASLDGILIVDKGKRILQNKQFNNLLKIPKHIIDNDDDEARIEWVRGLAKNPEEFYERVSYMFAHPDETTHDELELIDGTVLDGYSGPVIGEDGKRYGRIWTFRNTTERKEMEKTIEASEEKFRRIFEESPIGKVMVGEDFHFISANKTFCRMLGYTEQELTLLTFKDITHPDHVIEDALQVSDLMSGKISIYQVEKSYIRKDKDIVWGSTRVKIIRDKDGRFLYFLTSIEDIGQRKQAEEEKAHLESQLLQSQKMEAVGTLAGGIAHDFNNILTVISGFASLLQMDIREDDPKKDYIDQILTSSEKAAQLTQGLLAFSRKQQVSIKPLDINSTIKATLKLLKTLLTEDVELKTRLSEETAIIMADASQMDQILFNLVTNARDALRQGGALIVETKVIELDDDFIRTHGYGKSGKYALLSVSDTGIGMDEAIKSKIFDPFFTTKEVGKGTGLGLSTVYGIVKQHNGYITVYSEPSKGTTFRVYLPVVNEITRQEKKVPTPVKRGSETILVAEDNDTVRGLIKTVLTSYGYSIIEAVDGEDAMDWFTKTEQRIDLVILDTIMPKKNGREVYNEIKKIRPDIKVIFTSGYTRDIILDKGMVEGDKFEFIPKPISPSELMQKVRQVLDDGQVVN